MKNIKTFNQLFESVVDYQSLCRYENKEKIKKLLDSGFDINTIIYDDKTLLYLSAEYDNGNLKFLLENGADPNISKNNNWPLIRAIENIQDNNTIQLLEAGANINVRGKALKKSPLLYSTNWLKPTELTYILIDKGADWNLQDENGDVFLDYLGDRYKKEMKEKYPTKYKDAENEIFKNNFNI